MYVCMYVCMSVCMYVHAYVVLDVYVTNDLEKIFILCQLCGQYVHEIIIYCVRIKRFNNFISYQLITRLIHPVHMLYV